MGSVPVVSDSHTPFQATAPAHSRGLFHLKIGTMCITGGPVIPRVRSTRAGSLRDPIAMKPEGLPEKWIVGLDARAPVGDAAQTVLERRVDTVRSLVKSVVKSKAEDDEAVHQLRVSTRRAEAALLAFKPWLRRERRKQTKKALRKLRQAAASVRTCDVHLSLLRSTLPDVEPDERVALEASLLMVGIERRAALGELIRTARRTRRALEQIAGRWARRDDSTTDNGSATTDVVSAGRAALKDLAGELRDLGEGDLSCREHLHQMRMQGKRLRYAIEIFGATDERTAILQSLAQSVTDLQDRLGRVNDLREVAERLAHSASDVDAATQQPDGAVESALLHRQLESLADRFEDQCNLAVADFASWWRSDDSAEFRRSIDLLAEHSDRAAEAPPLPEVVIVAGSNGTADAPEEPASAAAHAAEGEH